MIMLCAVMLIAQTAKPAEARRVAVLDFVPVEVDAALAQAFTQLVAAELTRQGLDVISAKDVVALVSLEERKQMLGAYDTRAGAQIATLLNARFIVAGSVNKLGDKLLASAQLLDNQLGTAVNRATFEAASAEELTRGASQLARALLQDSGRLQLYDQVPGARLFLDDTLVGIMPLGIVPVRSEGKHRLHVESAEHAPWDDEITITRGRTTRLRVELVALRTLEDRSKNRRIAAYVTLAGAALTAATAALLFWSTFESKKQYDAMDTLLVTQRQLDDAAARTYGLYAGGFVAVAATAGLVTTAVLLLAIDPHRSQLEAADRALRFEPIVGPRSGGLSLRGTW